MRDALRGVDVSGEYPVQTRQPDGMQGNGHQVKLVKYILQTLRAKFGACLFIDQITEDAYQLFLLEYVRENFRFFLEEERRNHHKVLVGNVEELFNRLLDSDSITSDNFFRHLIKEMPNEWKLPVAKIQEQVELAVQQTGK